MTLRVYGNRPLKTLGGKHTRPTSARVREALFNILQGKITGCRWLDLCAGSGAMGAEALCRGAAFALGIDNAKAACAVVAQNWQRVAQPHQAFRVVRGDVAQQVARLEPQSFDYIYFDPPYASGLYEPVLQAIAAGQILRPGGALIAEHARDRTLPVTVSSQSSAPDLQQYRQKTYGRTALSFYSSEPEAR